MRRFGIVACVAVGLWLFAGDLVWAQAQTATAPQPQVAQQRLWGPRFVDANGDGICDFFGQGGRGMGRGRAAGGGWGPAFVDANGDGICDNYPQGGVGYGRLAGRGWGRGRAASAPAPVAAPATRGPRR